MAYATVQQFVDEVSEAEARALAPTQPAGGYDMARITKALDAASSELDTYFASRYATPLDPVPLTATQAAIAIAREILDRQGRDFVKQAAARARKWAADVAKGVAVLGGGAIGEDVPGAASDGGAVYDGPSRVFDDDGLAGFLGGC